MKIRAIDIEATSLRIRELITTKGFTTSDIQKMLSLQSVQSVYAWCSPKCSTLPDLQHMVQLADAFECIIEDIVETQEVDLPDEEQQDL